MTKRSGFTLMELLLVVAILAIIAAVAAPQFFRASNVAMDDARVMLMKANYQAVKNAINMAVWDEMNNQANIPAAQRILNKTFANTDTVKAAGSAIRILVDRGYLQEAACYIENQKGQKLFMTVANRTTGPATTITANPYDQVASVPIFMEKTDLFQVFVVDGTGAVAANVDNQLRTTGQNSWTQIYNVIKDNPGI